MHSIDIWNLRDMISVVLKCCGYDDEESCQKVEHDLENVLDEGSECKEDSDEQHGWQEEDLTSKVCPHQHQDENCNEKTDDGAFDAPQDVPHDFAMIFDDLIHVVTEIFEVWFK